jgi:flagellar FliL protein
MATAPAKPAKSEAEAAPDAPASPPTGGKGKKKLIIILVAAVVLLGAIGGGGFFIWQKKAAAAAAEAADSEGGHPVAESKQQKDQGPPIFVPLDPFVVNLADKGTDRYAQVSVTLQVENSKVSDDLKIYLPAIRNNILMILAHKTSEELMDRAGKDVLAEEILRESTRPLKESQDPKKKDSGAYRPILKVHFANFIIQ